MGLRLYATAFDPGRCAAYKVRWL